MFNGIRAIMIFAESPEKSARWWGGVLQAEVHLDIDGDAVYAWLNVAGVEFGFHPWTRIATGAAAAPCRTGPSTTSPPCASASWTPAAPTIAAHSTSATAQAARSHSSPTRSAT